MFYHESFPVLSYIMMLVNVIGFVFYVYFHKKTTNDLRVHVRHNYPNEWQKLIEQVQNNKQSLPLSGSKLASGISFNMKLDRSINQGFLHQQADPILRKITARKRLLIFLLPAIIVTNILLQKFLIS